MTDEHHDDIKPISLRGDAPPTEPTPPAPQSSQSIVTLVAVAVIFLLGGVMLATFITGGNGDGVTKEELRDTVNEVVSTQLAELRPTSTPIPPTPTLIPISDAADDDAFQGPEDAPVVIVEFSDFQCGYCGRFYTDALPQILETYPDEVRFVYRDFPIFGEDSVRAAMAAECAREQGMFWEMHNRLFAIHESDTAVALTEDALVSFAGEIGLETGDFQTCLASERYMEEVLKDMQAAQTWGLGGTPGYVINGTVYTFGAQPFSVFQSVIENELQAAAS